MLRSLATVIVATALCLSGTGLAQASEDGVEWSGDWSATEEDWDGWNRYEPTLPEFVTGRTAFEVRVAGNLPVCGMTFGTQARAAAPWAFSYFPGQDGSLLVEHCDGTRDEVWVTAKEPFAVTEQFLGPKGDAVSIENRLAEPAEVVVTGAGGQVVARTSLGEAGQATVALVSRAAMKATQMTVSVQSASGIRQEFTVARQVGWEVLMPSRGALYEPCSTIPWSYRDAQRPATSTERGIKSDIRGALARLSRVTGLRFQEVPDDPTLKGNGYGGAQVEEGSIRFTWEMGIGASGRGWTTGLVQLNPQDWWAGQDANAGFGRTVRGPAQRGWLVVHEVMHVLGLGHVDDRVAVMYPVNGGQRKLSKGDLAGLRALYPRNGC